MSDFLKKKRRSRSYSSISAPLDFRCISHVDENSTLRDALYVMSNGKNLGDHCAVPVTTSYFTQGKSSQPREALEAEGARVSFDFGGQCVPLTANSQDYVAYANVPFMCAPSISSNYGNSSPQLIRRKVVSTQGLYAMQDGASYTPWISHARSNSSIIAAQPRMSPAGTISHSDGGSPWLNRAGTIEQSDTCYRWMNPAGTNNLASAGGSQISPVETFGQANAGYPRMNHAESNNSLGRQHRPLQRTRSKSFSQIGEAVGHDCSCTVCKERVITNKLYFPVSTLRLRDKNMLKKEQKASAGEGKLPSSKDVMPNGVAFRNTTKEVPSPPPRGIFRAESRTSKEHKELEYSIIKSCSYGNLSADYLEMTTCEQIAQNNDKTTCEQVAQNNDNVMPPEEDSEDEDSGRVSITSMTEDEEMTITRL
ncbi:unnamed protein product [Cylicocyclus nassatus]|uniref:Uncharacterized protein n=1 Tax=Cylicocyclus nassatus TaxID=53992 RepID=A0AA36M5U3_CYLNA|nr:unnamed protein product [Cylicocyclus nassatus]